VHAACWAHARRKVFEAMKLSPDDRVATQLVARIDDLFAIDAEALLRWTAGLSEPADAITTMAPFLVGLTFRAKGFTGAYALIDHVDSVTTVAHYSHCLPCDTGVERAVIPLSGGVVSLIERRCVGSPVCGRYLAR
jgi:hypothetical protein